MQRKFIILFIAVCFIGCSGCAKTTLPSFNPPETGPWMPDGIEVKTVPDEIPFDENKTDLDMPMGSFGGIPTGDAPQTYLGVKCPECFEVATDEKPFTHTNDTTKNE